MQVTLTAVQCMQRRRKLCVLLSFHERVLLHPSAVLSGGPACRLAVDRNMVPSICASPRVAVTKLRNTGLQLGSCYENRAFLHREMAGAPCVLSLHEPQTCLPKTVHTRTLI